MKITNKQNIMKIMTIMALSGKTMASLTTPEPADQEAIESVQAVDLGTITHRQDVFRTGRLVDVDGHQLQDTVIIGGGTIGYFQHPSYFTVDPDEGSGPSHVETMQSFFLTQTRKFSCLSFENSLYDVVSSICSSDAHLHLVSGITPDLIPLVELPTHQIEKFVYRMCYHMLQPGGVLITDSYIYKDVKMRCVNEALEELFFVTARKKRSATLLREAGFDNITQRSDIVFYTNDRGEPRRIPLLLCRKPVDARDVTLHEFMCEYGVDLFLFQKIGRDSDREEKRIMLEGLIRSALGAKTLQYDDIFEIASVINTALHYCCKWGVTCMELVNITLFQIACVNEPLTLSASTVRLLSSQGELTPQQRANLIAGEAFRKLSILFEGSQAPIGLIFRV